MKTPHSISLLGICAAFAWSTAGSSDAAIALVNSVGFGNVTGSGDDADGNPATRTVGASELGTFNANGVDKLVVTVGGEGNSNGAESNLVTSVTYGGVPMNKVVDRYGGGNRGNSMWYLDDVSVTGEFVITFAQSQSGLGFAAYALNGTLAGTAAATASTTANTATAGYNADMTMSITVPGEFVIAALARNNFDDGGGQGVVAPLTQLFYATSTDGSSAAGAYQFVPAAGTVTPTIYNLTNGVGSVIAASFQPVPEPSCAALLTLGALGLTRRRRA